MRKVEPKLLMFYGGTLVFVVALFQMVTRYGDTKLVAMPNVNGRYLSTETMPGCPENSRVLLTISQSGIYLNGSVNVVENETAIEDVTSERTPPLSGRLVQQQLNMDGKGMALCQVSAGRVQVEGAIVTEADKKLSFNGKILLGEAEQPWVMQGVRLVESKKKEGH
jgi:hypothetical protein